MTVRLLLIQNQAWTFQTHIFRTGPSAAGKGIGLGRSSEPTGVGTLVMRPKADSPWSGATADTYPDLRGGQILKVQIFSESIPESRDFGGSIHAFAPKPFLK
jgi:hypothetical protein